ncbi:zinc finger CCHC-type and RNA-binding motif-containing protein 1-like [Toxorhynchites rutilus septentrionalis]|uniref:zinc finger CCHC-type and RNA-binding motif-containing protein 1-like n=1 Tax=Toxorhynchites rutilus septentrionalis TaxID=329112 RepID=UPI0024790187|nr:zinc finger CCHC-type and RNA-binding motif-containing protein 1-like [Toxorhynchites rutilus septentrionalis]
MTQSSSAVSNRSTAYISNLPFDLTNIDVRRILEKHGQIARVTILRDRQTRKSKGVAFVHFSNAKEADQCCTALDNVEMFGRTLKASIAKDNGKGGEFAKRRDYPDKSRCYECGEQGHISYKCPRNVLGDKSPPRTKDQKKGGKRQIGKQSRSDGVGLGWESDEDERLRRIVENQEQGSGKGTKRVKYKKSAYFSDDEEVDDD